MTPNKFYQQALDAGFTQDPLQQTVVEELQGLYDTLVTSPARASFITRLLRKHPSPQGLYLWGGTGRGKTWLVDGFYASLPIQQKHRSHFHSFMRDMHTRLQLLPKTPDPLKLIASDLASNMRLLCLDEFHVHDIGDAMIMTGLLEAIFAQGITLVATSNTAIEDLYKNGLQRERFIPTIRLLKQHTKEIDLGNTTDYRRIQLDRNGTYFIGNAEDGRLFLQQQLDAIAPCTPKRQRQVIINQRPIYYVAYADDVIWFDFEQICNTPRSDSDYINIAQTCHTVMIANVPYMDEEHDNIAKRFIHLIDAIYDHQVKCIITAIDEPVNLYRGKALKKAFERTISRLVDMDSEKYLALPHRLDTA